MSFRGAVKALIPTGLFRKIEPWGHLAEAFLMQVLYGFPARGLKIIGVTGTNGKTSTCFMIQRMIHGGGYKVGLMTTVGWGVGDKITPQIEHMTTMPTRQLLKRIKKLKNSRAEWIVMEVTSHALGQNRVWGIAYDIAVLTNITHEHLDYHGTFENYRDAKLKLFEKTAGNGGGLGIGVVNADDPSAELFAKAVPRALTYGVKKGDLRAKNIKSTPSGSQFTAEAEGVKLDIKTNLPGSFNVYNALAAAGAGLALQMPPEQIERGIAALESVEGRMNTINEGQDFEVIVDYAHTPDSFEIIFNDIRKAMDSRATSLDAVQESSEERASRTSGTASERKSVTDTAMRQEPAGAAGSAGRQGKAVRGSGRLLVMFGSAGRRDVAKRGILGEIAGKYADLVVATEEDDRDTDGQLILNQIAEGAEKSGKTRDKDLFLVHNREKAIKFILGRAQKGDTVLLLGKGHEKNIERGNREDPYDEVAITRKLLKNL